MPEFIVGARLHDYGKGTIDELRSEEHTSELQSQR